MHLITYPGALHVLAEAGGPEGGRCSHQEDPWAVVRVTGAACGKAGAAGPILGDFCWDPGGCHCLVVPADVKLVRHLPMKGPRKVKQVVFPLLTAGSSSPKSSELQPKLGILGLLHQDLAGCGQPVLLWVSVNPNNNDYTNPGEGFVDSVSVC